MTETLGTIWSSTSLSASNRTVQRARPAGGLEHANAVRRASNAPSKVRSRCPERSLRPRAASIPSTTKRSLTCSMVRAETPRAPAT